jgi:FkbM family methyltransferase
MTAPAARTTVMSRTSRAAGNPAPILTAAYKLAAQSNLLRMPLGRAAFIFAYFAYKRLYEDPFWQLIRQRADLFTEGDILDIGANIGYTSWLFSQLLSPESKVYSFEPDDLNFDLLEHVIRKRKLLNRVIPIRAAVGASDGYVKLWHNPCHHGDHRVLTDHLKTRISNSAAISSVPVFSVDKFVESQALRKISFIKIDVQGYELAVCEGMRSTLMKFPNVLVAVEYAPEALTDLGFEAIEVLKFFRSQGWRTYVLTGKSMRSADSDSVIEQSVAARGYVDLLFSKRALIGDNVS